jgi:hypothetical protein
MGVSTISYNFSSFIARSNESRKLSYTSIMQIILVHDITNTTHSIMTYYHNFIVLVFCRISMQVCVHDLFATIFYDIYL